MPSSETQKTSSEVNDDFCRWHPAISQNASSKLSDFAPLTIEEATTYRKWRRACIVVYGTLAVTIAMSSIAVRPSQRSVGHHHDASSPRVGLAGQINQR